VRANNRFQQHISNAATANDRRRFAISWCGSGDGAAASAVISPVSKSKAVIQDALRAEQTPSAGFAMHEGWKITAHSFATSITSHSPSKQEHFARAPSSSGIVAVLAGSA